MNRLFKKLISLLSSLHRALTPAGCEKQLYQYFRIKNQRVSQANVSILVQCVEDTFYYGLFGQIVTSLRVHQAIHVEQYVLRSLNVAEFKSLWSFLKNRFVINTLISHKWVRLYATYCNSVGYRSTSLTPVSDMTDFYRAWKLWRSLEDKKALIELEIEGIAVGDLVNDSFLRFKPAPTVNLKDRYLLVLLWQACRDVRRAKGYFAKVRPKLYLTSYSTYIQHGIPVRVALQYGVHVFSFGNYQEFTKELNLTDSVHTKNPDAYADEFARLNDQDVKLAQAQAALLARMSGSIDSATAYMKKSAYVESGDIVPDVRGAVIVFLHDFFDSPHVYREMVFPDFWEWVCLTMETLKAANIPFFVKPHPNQINLSGSVLNELKCLYPDMPMIPSSITNKQLVEAGMACAVTIYGTIAHEMAYLGVPTVACARHPHISYDFCKTAKTKAEYVTHLMTCADLPINKEEMRQQSLAFYYMHNLHITENGKLLRDAVMSYRVACNTGDCIAQDLAEMLERIAKLEGYQDFISSLKHII